MRSLYLYYALQCLPVAWSSVTVYNQHPFVTTATDSAAAASYTGAAAYDPTVLNPPPPPVPALPSKFFQQLSSAPVPGLSLAQGGHFLGFSVEFSVINSVIGTNSTRLQVPFLNLLSNVQGRGGKVRIRIGGNTQESATLVPTGLADGKLLEKEAIDQDNPTKTPALLYSPDVLYMLANVSSLLNVQWYLGIPLNDTTNLRLAIAEFGDAILGDRVIGYQVGNEPDEYAKHNKRPPTYSQADYSREFGIVDTALRADSNIPVVDGKLLGPSVSGPWTPESVWDVGFLTDHHESLAAISMMRYPHTSCSSTGTQRDPQDLFPSYLNHTASQIIVEDYLPGTALAQTFSLPFVMIETNTASCGGFPGISNSFGSAIFLLDYALQMASSNFTNAMLHVSGQGVYYNPFTPPPTNQTSFRNWTVGAPYYAVLAVAETFGKSNKSQIIDLQMNDNNIFTPGYAIYDAGILSRLALFNYVTDTSGGNDYTMSFAIGGGTTGQANGTPAQVKVKYLLAPSVSVKDNITWAGQTFGTAFESVGRPMGTEQIQTVNCNSDNTCDIKVPAPGFALVFLDQNNPPFSEDVQVFTATSTAGQAEKTFNTLVIDPAVVATANGQPGTNYLQAGTSPGKRPNGARVAQSVPCIVVAMCMAIGVVRVLGGVV